MWLKANPSGPPTLATAPAFFVLCFHKIAQKSADLVELWFAAFFLRSLLLLCFDPLENPPRNLEIAVKSVFDGL
jgi:hypothetical protein